MSPIPDDGQSGDVAVKEGDLIKVDLGVHFDGFVANIAHTYIVDDPKSPPPYLGKKADVICAAHYAAECAHRLLRPGHKNTEITGIIKKVAEAFHVNAVEAVLSHELKQFCIDANNVIMTREEPGQKAAEFDFEINQVFAIDIVMSSGTGKTKEISARTTIFKRCVDRSYQLKNQSSRDLLREINANYPELPFTLRALDKSKRLMGIKEIVSHDLVDSYPVLYEKPGEFVAQFKFVAIILPNQTLRLGGPFPLPHVTSQYDINNSTDIQAVMAMSIEPEQEKKKGMDLEIPKYT